MSYPPHPPQGGNPPGTPYPGQASHPAAPFQSAPSGTPPGYPGGPPPQGAPYPPTYPAITPVPVLSSRIGLLVLGGLFILGAVFLTVGWVSSDGGTSGGYYYFLVALGAAIALAVMAATLGFAAVRGLRGGWFLGVTIAATLLLFPSGLAASAAYQNDWALTHSQNNHNGIHTRAPYVPCADGICEVENRAADFDHTARVIDADNAQVTLDLTRASESMTNEIVLNMDESEGVILVRPDQALQLSVSGENSQFTKLSSADDTDWFPSALSGNFQKVGANSLFTSNTRMEPAVTFSLNVNLDSSAVQLRVIDPQSEAMPFSQRRERALPQSGSNATEPATTDTSQSSGQGETR